MLPAFQTSFDNARYKELLSAEAQKMQDAFLVHRLFTKDATLWTSANEEHCMDWLDLPRAVARRAAEVEAFGKELTEAGFKSVVMLGMGGSVGAALALQSFVANLGAKKPFEFFVLDTLAEENIAALESQVDLKTTLFVVASKSGKTVETGLLWRHFFDRIEGAVGQVHAGRHFIAITDPKTPLATDAVVNNFRRVFEGEVGVGGRYSALSVFGLLPAVFLGVDLGALSTGVLAMYNACAPQVLIQANPGAALGLALFTLKQQNRDKLTIVAHPALTGFSLWLEQLIAESTGKMGTGLIPVVNEPSVPATSYGADRAFLYLTTKIGPEEKRRIDELSHAGHPVLTIEVDNVSALAGEFFRFEMATAVFCSLLGLNPFDQPDVDRLKVDLATLRAQSADFESHAQSRVACSRAEVGNHLNPFLGACEKDSTLFFNAFLANGERTDAFLQPLRFAAAQHGIATMSCIGPRYLHSVGQLQKGGPKNMSMVVFTEESTSTEFGALLLAQALLDFEALRALGRRLLWIHIVDGR